MTIADSMQRRYANVPLHEIDILLAHCLQKDTIFLYSHPKYRLTPAQRVALQTAIHRRQRGEPMAYITGHKEFFGLDFCVNRAVLIPRPDTELLVEHALEYLPKQSWSKPPVVVDIGTGSGNIAISLAKEFPQAAVTMTDISKNALRVAQKNAQRHQVSIQKYCGHLLEALPRRYHRTINVLTCNAPYLSKVEARKSMLAYEPKVALTPPLGSSTQLIEELLRQAPAYVAPRAVIFLEIGYRQAHRVTAFCQRLFPNCTITIYQDLGKFDRLVECQVIT